MALSILFGANRLQGTVLVTGSGRGLGAALVESFLNAGFDVIATFPYGASSDLVQLAKEHPQKVRLLSLNVVDDDSVQNAVRELQKKGSRLDILINNAALNLDIDDPLPAADIDAIRKQMDVNVYGPLRVIQGFLPLLEQSDRGILVNISSEAGSVGACSRVTGFGYCMSKAALNMQSRILENYLAPMNIKVFSIHPGWMRTDMGGSDADIDPSQAADGVLKIVASDDYLQTPMYVTYSGEQYPY